MNRTTIDFGIDLGTTNSAIAVLSGVTTEIIKNNEGNAEITPSAVAIDKKGVLSLGQRAKNKTIDAPEDAYIEFKRRMGTDYLYHFKSSGLSKKPEELSAEVLKALREDVQQRTREVVEAAVITVPAAFELHQCDATRKAAQLAGLKESPLVQEPVAAALAYGFQADEEKAYWLVYDFGGGTFDAALIKSEEGMIHVVNHGGDNFLGGSDLDWALVDKIVVPKISSRYGLEDFSRANSGVGKRWYRAFMRLKFAVEQAKIDLSRHGVQTASLDSGYANNLTDDLTRKIVIEDLDCEITKDELIRIAEPFILRSTTIAMRVLKEKNLSPNAVERVILVGGPTLAPYFRELISKELGIRLDHSVDPLTVVARGAAIFSGTQRCNVKPLTAVATGEYSIDLKHKPVGIDDAPIVGGRLSGSAAQDFSGFTIEFVNAKSQWRSGKVGLRPDGTFVANLHAERAERNIFAIELSDPNGRKLKVTPATLTYTIGAVVEEQPIITSMGIALANNENDTLFEKGRGLPLKANRDYRTIHMIRQGQCGDLIRIPIVEGDHELADRNRLVGELNIGAANIRRDLPAGSAVEVTLRMDESRIITVTAYVPLLDEEFSKKIELRRTTPNATFLQEDYEREMGRFRQVQSKAAAAGGETAKSLIHGVEASPLMLEVKETLSAAGGDPDAAAKCEKRLLELKLKLDEAANALEWPALVAETNDWLGYLKKVVEAHGNPEQTKQAEELTGQVGITIREQKPDRLRKQIERLSRLYYEILAAQPSWWVFQFQRMEKERGKMTDQNRAVRLLDQGQDCMAKNNAIGLQNIVRQLWEMLPQDVAEAARRGYQSGVLR